jgi:PPE-repeat protein
MCQVYVTFGHANLMEAGMTKRSRLIDGLWCGALALAAVAAAGDLVPWMTDMASQLAALMQEARA